jgi:hypothetical protein
MLTYKAAVKNGNQAKCRELVETAKSRHEAKVGKTPGTPATDKNNQIQTSTSGVKSLAELVQQSKPLKDFNKAQLLQKVKESRPDLPLEEMKKMDGLKLGENPPK